MSNRLRTSLISTAKVKRFGPVAIDLLGSFCDAIGEGKEPNEAFESAAQETQMVGSEAAILATRMKCELLIREVFERSEIPAPSIDCMSPTLMAAYDKSTGEVPGIPLEERL